MIVDIDPPITLYDGDEVIYSTVISYDASGEPMGSKSRVIALTRICGCRLTYDEQGNVATFSLCKAHGGIKGTVS